VHGPVFRVWCSGNWIAADILRIEDGTPVEHWDVIQDEATKEQSKSGKPIVRRQVSGVACIVRARRIYG